jgi:phosphomevalonate kinase
LTPEMRAEVQKMDEYSERIRFLCKYKIETMSDVDNIKKQKKEELQKILNIRNRLYYKRQKLDSEIEKDSVTKEIIEVTSVLTKVRKEIKLCDEIYDNVPRMKEQIKEVDEKEKKYAKEKEEKNLKKEER